LYGTGKVRYIVHNSLLIHSCPEPNETSPRPPIFHVVFASRSSMSTQEYKTILPFLCHVLAHTVKPKVKDQQQSLDSLFNLHTHLLLVPLNITWSNFTPCIYLNIQKFATDACNIRLFLDHFNEEL
jgi:hypothetical protein